MSKPDLEKSKFYRKKNAGSRIVERNTHQWRGVSKAKVLVRRKAAVAPALNFDERRPSIISYLSR